MKNSLLIFSLAAAVIAVAACQTAKSTAAAPTPAAAAKPLVTTPEALATREDTINNAAMKTWSKKKANQMEAAPMHVEKQVASPTKN